MTTTSSAGGTEVHRSLRTYERLLVLYPKPFREQYGHDMIQLFGDLVTRMGDGNSGRVWPRVLLDLVTSATRQRIAALATPGGRRPSARVLLAVAVFLGLSAVVGNPMFLPLGLTVSEPVVGGSLFVLPLVGLILLRRVWVAWRTVAARRWVRAGLGLACFAPGTWWIIANDGGGWWTFILIMMTLIWGLGLGAIWAVATLIRARRRPADGRRRWTAVAMITVATVVLGSMAAAGFNSYLEARKPPGDHSAANASPVSSALWEASKSGDKQAVVAMIDACADPFVDFADRTPFANTGVTARSYAEWNAGVNWGNPDLPSEPALSRHRAILDLLVEAESTWTERCN